MPDEPSQFRERLFESQQMTPALREAYEKELNSLLYEPLTLRRKVGGFALLLLFVALVIGEVYAMIVNPGSAVLYGAATTMLIACGLAAVWIARDLTKKQTSRKSSQRVPQLFYGAAGILITIQLIHGLRAPSDPASTYGVVYILVFLMVCSDWVFGARISAVELAAREQMLRIECRLAELSERLTR